jgi:hypothetical protein
MHDSFLINIKLVSKLTSLETTPTNRNKAHNEIRRTVSSGDAYYLVLKLLSITLKTRDIHNNNFTICFV